MFSAFTKSLCFQHSLNPHVFSIHQIPMFSAFTKSQCFQHSPNPHVFSIHQIPMFSAFTKSPRFQHSPNHNVFSIHQSILHLAINLFSIIYCPRCIMKEGTVQLFLITTLCNEQRPCCYCSRIIIVVPNTESMQI